MYKVFGYSCDLIDFELRFDSFVQAVKAYMNLDDQLCVVSITRDKVGSCRHVKTHVTYR